MAGNQAQFDFGAAQALTNKTDHSQYESHAAHGTMSNNIGDTVTGGLAGVVQHTAFSVGQDRDGAWSRTFDFAQQLVSNNKIAANHYDSGQNDAHQTFAGTQYGGGDIAGAINV
jgi:hypothetical protein